MRIERLGLGSARQDYQRVWDYQRQVHAQVADGAESVLLEVEHESVYTAGKRTSTADRMGVQAIDVDRGGRITWHGPGQLVVYPIVRLREPVDVISYVRALEQAVIDLAAELGLPASRVQGRSGVWIRPADHRPRDGAPRGAHIGQDRKLAAIGVRVARGVSMHGLALNVTSDLAAFAAIVPCGIPDADVTSLRRELGHSYPLVEIADRLEPHLVAALGPLADEPVGSVPAHVGRRS